ncbi:hypothetical protein MF672_007725 [Actinomadura sp. ATCC 31491]|uniref:Uncharacterized protein n=1 Tax=Actinomadura luzonensis TaxID=2805427 RepID=A0ABT0FND1_9ACTN|nr:hypothetical protein [Actinomadura luzonensis]MCK2213678.1 hypothetical protein [Actinomadura luzonensis]
MADADADTLAGDGELAAAAEAPLHVDGFGGRLGFGAGGAGVPEAGHLIASERVGQGSQQRASIGKVQQDAVDADGQPASGELVANRALPTALRRPGRWR